MIPRALSSRLKEAARQFPVVCLTGPRQSGKTTLARSVFPKHDYVSLEAPDHRRFALEDPRGFLAQFKGAVILDEVQRTPELFSYIQGIVDGDSRHISRFILTGSQNFLLLEKVTQSLAGRSAVLHLLPFSLAELSGRPPLVPDLLGKPLSKRGKVLDLGLMETMHRGFYPPIHDKKLRAKDWLDGYYQTYIERDVRHTLNVGDAESFGRFVRLCAGRCGNLVNLSSLASDCGITHTTAKRWLSVLEASFIITLLRPHHRNFGKRLVKSPKLYFLDTGLLCYLLQIGSPSELAHRAERGAVFESFVVSEFIKGFMHKGERPGLSFWRDSKGREVDILVERSGKLFPVEVKSSQTIASDFYANLNFWRELSGDPEGPAALVYGGQETYKRTGVFTYPWQGL